MADYPTTKLDRIVDSAIARENAAVIEEERTGKFVDTPDRQWFRELFADPAPEPVLERCADRLIKEGRTQRAEHEHRFLDECPECQADHDVLRQSRTSLINELNRQYDEAREQELFHAGEGKIIPRWQFRDHFGCEPEEYLAHQIKERKPT